MVIKVMIRVDSQQPAMYQKVFSRILSGQPLGSALGARLHRCTGTIRDPSNDSWQMISALKAFEQIIHPGEID